jgi:hypothetical protein
LNDQVYQTEESTRFVKERFSLNYGAFAFPYGDRRVSGKFFIQIYSSGLIDISFGTSGMMKDTFPSHIQRFSLEKPLMPARNIVALQFARTTYKLLRGLGKIERE